MQPPIKQQVRQHTRVLAERDALQQSSRRQRHHDENVPPVNSPSETCNTQSAANAFLPTSMRFGSLLLPSLGCLTPSQRANILQPHTSASQPHTPALAAICTYNALSMPPLMAARLLARSSPRVTTESAPTQHVSAAPSQPEDFPRNPSHASQADPVPNWRSLVQQARRARERAAKDLCACMANPQQPSPPQAHLRQVDAPASQPPNRWSLAQQARRAQERASRGTIQVLQDVQQASSMKATSVLPTPLQTQQLRPDSQVSQPPSNRWSLAQQARRVWERASCEATQGSQGVQPPPLGASPSPTQLATVQSSCRPSGNSSSVSGQPSGSRESETQASRPTILCRLPLAAWRLYRDPEARHDLGCMTIACPYCGALHWDAERTAKSCRTATPEFWACCNHGKVTLTPLRYPPATLCALLEADDAAAREFRTNIRAYNAALAFTSLSVKMDDSINRDPTNTCRIRGGSTYVFRILGQLCHKSGVLEPAPG
ncbi:hypothetical protein BDN71DRAFT_1509752 [Pleurotus eryngii]|uniref:Uncharacterized protein n=1 Tax=Pleurotus eryngii TaxID=5323 RepID=A0A9P6D4B0_PLEER|nr:hypothetical protein BDN71DRAFT_1509752 [Pleurotus eryngii]